jgi:uncharacterized membrane protein YdbT with pleckstrin-like domain
VRQQATRADWEDQPSFLLLAGVIVKWLLWLALVVLTSTVWQIHLRLPLWVAAAALHIGLRAWDLKSTKYQFTSRRLNITSGIWRQRKVTYDLNELRDAVITRPFLLRVCGMGHVFIATPGVALRGIRSPEVVRNIVRDFGQQATPGGLQYEGRTAKGPLP